MKLDFEKLMHREQVVFSEEEEKRFFQNTVCMVTGGGGSIGSELCRQLLKCGAKKVIVIDIYENGAYDLQQELWMKCGPEIPLVIEIASVQDRKKMECLLKEYRPDYLFHAAFHKHVPLMEHNPEEAVKNNVFGTWNLAELSQKWKVPHFVLISTDKAVNPTSVMGATKRLSEMIVSYFSQQGKASRFVTVRFGNVLASNGSVIPLFCRQVEMGGPVTVTHPQAERYLMTIPEAVLLIMRSVMLSKGGEIFVLDMGNPVKITELAEAVIRSYGYTPGKEIELKFTGLRPGEKLTEQLSSEEEHCLATEDKKIFVSMGTSVEEDKLLKNLQELYQVLENGNRDSVLHKLGQAVPEFCHDAHKAQRFKEECS